MFRPVPMARLRLVVLEQDERAVLRFLGRAGVVQMTRTPAGPDTAPLPPRQRGDELARLEHLSTRLDNLRRSVVPESRKPKAEARKVAEARMTLGAREGLPPHSSSGDSDPGLQAGRPAGTVAFKQADMSLKQAEQIIHAFEEKSGSRLDRRHQLQQRLAELAAVSRQISDYGEVELPLDRRDESSLLHFVTGSVPAKNLEKIEIGENVALLPLAGPEGRQLLIAMTTRQGRPALDRALQQAGFQPEPLPVVTGATTAALLKQNQREQTQTAAELDQLDAALKVSEAEFSPARAHIENAITTERRLLDAEQNFPRTESTLLVTGWVPSADIPPLLQQVQDITHGRCAAEVMPAEQMAEAEIPVLLRHPRLLRPFALLVTAYGLPHYRELEPTLFVAISYLLMFGMMFGDAGHGLLFACGGLALMWRSRQAQLRDVGLLLLFCGLSSILFGVVYGSYFGLPALKKFALWHDPLEGNPLGFMSTAIGIGIVLMSLGLVFNVINSFRRGHVLGGFLNKFGVAGMVFYWGSLALLLKFAALQARGLAILAAILFLLVPVLAWTLKEPIEFVRQRRAGRAVSGGSLSGSFMESLVEVFEGVMSYLSNTISFVRLAAYAMSHSALLLAAFMMADQIKHVPAAGGPLSLLVIVLGNLVALVLEGIIAAVQALRLEYYEFFSKFFSGNGQPFQPFCLTAREEIRAG